MQIKLMFRWKVLPLASIWKWEFLELENGLLSLDPKAKPSYAKQRRRLGAESQQAWRGGGGAGLADAGCNWQTWRRGKSNSNLNLTVAFTCFLFYYYFFFYFCFCITWFFCFSVRAIKTRKRKKKLIWWNAQKMNPLSWSRIMTTWSKTGLNWRKKSTIAWLVQNNNSRQ